VERASTDWAGVGFGVGLGVLAAYQQFKLAPALPLLLPQLGDDRLLAGLLMSVFAIAGLVLSVPVGRLQARSGPAPLVALALSSMLVGNVLALVPPVTGLGLLASRTAEGIAFTVMAIAGAVIATESAAPRTRPLAVALWASWVPFGQVLAVAVAAPSVAAGAWRPLWLVAVALTVAAGGLCWYRFGFAALRLRYRSRRPAPRGPAPANGFRGGVGGPVWLAAGLFMLWSLQFMAFMTWLPQYLVEAHGLAPGRAVLAYAVPPLLSIVGNLVAGAALRAGLGVVSLLVPMFAIQALVWLLLPWTASGWSGVASLAAWGLASGATATGLFAMPYALADHAESPSQAYAALLTGRNVGVLFGPVLVPALISLAGGWGLVGPIFGLLTALLAVAVLPLGRSVAKV